MLHHNTNGILTDTKDFHIFELIRRNNKASLVNMLVTFCGKLECSFLTATMLFLYLHFWTTAKVPRPKTWQITKVFLLRNYETKFYDQRIWKATGLWKVYESYSVSDVTLHICESWSASCAFVAWLKRCHKSFVMWCVTPIYFSVRTYTKLETPLSPPTPLALQSVKMKICIIYVEAAVRRCSS